MSHERGPPVVTTKRWELMASLIECEPGETVPLHFHYLAKLAATVNVREVTVPSNTRGVRTLGAAPATPRIHVGYSVIPNCSNRHARYPCKHPLRSAAEHVS